MIGSECSPCCAPDDRWYCIPCENHPPSPYVVTPSSDWTDKCWSASYTTGQFLRCISLPTSGNFTVTLRYRLTADAERGQPVCVDIPDSIYPFPGVYKKPARDVSFQFLDRQFGYTLHLQYRRSADWDPFGCPTFDYVDRMSPALGGVFGGENFDEGAFGLEFFVRFARVGADWIVTRTGDPAGFTITGKALVEANQHGMWVHPVDLFGEYSIEVT